MAKSRSIYVCNSCGAESSQYFGKCTVCGDWNTMVEQAAPPSEPAKISSLRGRSRSSSGPNAAKPKEPRLALMLNQIEDRPQPRQPSGYEELDRVLGGGIVPGSLVLVGGRPWYRQINAIAASRELSGPTDGGALCVCRGIGPAGETAIAAPGHQWRRRSGGMPQNRRNPLLIPRPTPPIRASISCPKWI